MEFSIKAEDGDGTYGWFGAVGAFPTASTRVIGDEPLDRRFAKSFNHVGVSKVAIANAGHGGREEGVPVEEDIAAPVDGPDAGDWRDHALLSGVVDGVPAEGGFNGAQDGAVGAGSFDGLFVGVPLPGDCSNNFIERAAFAGADSDGTREVRSEVRTRNPPDDDLGAGRVRGAHFPTSIPRCHRRRWSERRLSPVSMASPRSPIEI